jgi:hypothetical protein
MVFVFRKYLYFNDLSVGYGFKSVLVEKNHIRKSLIISRMQVLYGFIIIYI